MLYSRKLNTRIVDLVVLQRWYHLHVLVQFLLCLAKVALDLKEEGVYIIPMTTQ